MSAVHVWRFSAMADTTTAHTEESWDGPLRDSCHG